MKKRLTRNQIAVIELLRRRGAVLVSAETERHWKNGKRYYLDMNLIARRGIMRMFTQGNREAEPILERKKITIECELEWPENSDNLINAIITAPLEEPDDWTIMRLEDYLGRDIDEIEAVTEYILANDEIKNRVQDSLNDGAQRQPRRTTTMSPKTDRIIELYRNERRSHEMELHARKMEDGLISAVRELERVNNVIDGRPLVSHNLLIILQDILHK